MDDFLGNHFPHQRLQCALNPEIYRLAQLLFEIASDTQEIPQGFFFRPEFYGDVDVRIFTSLSPGVTAEESEAHHAEALSHLIFVCLQEHR